MTFTVEPIISYERSSNVYIILSEREALIVDAGLPDFIAYNMDIIEKALSKVSRVYLVFTHCHFDHVFGYKVIKRACKRIETYAHELDADDIRRATFKSFARFFGSTEGVEIDHEVKEGDILEFGSAVAKVYHTPGHTEGSISILIDEYAFVGDLIFYRAYGRYDFYSGNYNDLLNSIERLSRLTIRKLFPGHGSIVGAPKENFEAVLELLKEEKEL